MIIKTKIFELYDGHYRSLSELAGSMEISLSQVYGVKEGKRSINQQFIIGATKAFPEYKLDDLFYLVPEPMEEKRQEDGLKRGWETIALSAG